MRYVVQTATETSQVNPDNGRSSLVLTNKVTIPCQSHKEASEITDGFNSIPGRQAWAGVEYYGEGGQKFLLSFSDVYEIASLATRLDRDGVRASHKFEAIAAE